MNLVLEIMVGSQALSDNILKFCDEFYCLVRCDSPLSIKVAQGLVQKILVTDHVFFETC